MKEGYWRNISVKDRVIEIIEELTGYKGLKENKNIDLLENEILDSLAFVELITSLEEEFDIEIQPTQVNPDTWRSAEKIAQLVKSLR